MKRKITLNELNKIRQEYIELTSGTGLGGTAYILHSFEERIKHKWPGDYEYILAFITRGVK